MRLRQCTSLALVGAFLMMVAAGPALANPGTVVTDSELDQALAGRTDEDAASRAVIFNWLDQSQVVGVASRAGVDLTRVKAAVSTLTGDELRDVEAQARLADQSLSGGDEKIVIGTTAIIIILLVIIILVAAD